MIIYRSRTDSPFEHIIRDLLAVKVEHGQLVILVGNGFDELISRSFRFIEHILRDFFPSDILALFIVIDLRAHLNKVDDAAEGGFDSDGKLNGCRLCAEPRAHHFHYIAEVSTDYIHLVDICNARNMILFRLMPDGLALGLNAALCAEYRNRTIQNP